jgi:hypothetical protein
VTGRLWWTDVWPESFAMRNSARSVDMNVTFHLLKPRAVFPKLWSADHRRSSGSALVVLLD